MPELAGVHACGKGCKVRKIHSGIMPRVNNCPRLKVRKNSETENMGERGWWNGSHYSAILQPTPPTHTRHSPLPLFSLSTFLRTFSLGHLLSLGIVPQCMFLASHPFTHAYTPASSGVHAPNIGVWLCASDLQESTLKWWPKGDKSHFVSPVTVHLLQVYMFCTLIHT